MRTTFLAFACLLPSVGCLTLKPIGPLANPNAAAKPRGPDGSAAVVMPPKDAPAGPVPDEGPRPARPAYEVTPGEVSDGNAADIVAKLKKELDADRATADAMPRYPEVSRVKR